MHSRVIVVGAGVFGCWSAWWLADAGHQVTLLDAYGPANGRASSADHSRVIRSGYGADVIYVRWAAASWRDWEWLAAHTGRPLLTATGALFLGAPGHGYLRETFETLTSEGLPVQWLEPSRLAARFPQIDAAGLGPAVLEERAGVLRARQALRALHDALRMRGVDCRTAQVQPFDEDADHAPLLLSDGTVLDADVIVAACGPWLPQLFPRSVGSRIRATRQEVLYFGVPAGDDRFSAARLPVWIDFGAGLYGIPDLDGQGVKVGIDRHGPIIDPDREDRLVSASVVTAVRDWLATRFPGLAGMPLVDARVCQYENTSTGDFLIDRHPRWDRVWMVGGGSGHGFKHGPAVGRHVAALVRGEAGVEPRFALAGKSGAAARAVY